MTIPKALDQERHAMETGSAFQIKGTVCQVVPEQYAGDLVAASDVNNGHGSDVHIIGSCSLQGERYVILCERAVELARKHGQSKLSDLLSRRELEVAMLVSEGEGNKQIADRLSLSEWTVSTYLRRIYAKLGVHSRAAMVARIIADVRR